MVDGPHDTLGFTISTADLESAVKISKDMSPLVLYREAWETLMAERARREFRAPCAPINLGRAAFDGLPEGVKALLEKSK
jgi:hypothetical protein